MQARLDIEALDTLPEYAPSTARLDDHRDADGVVVGVLAAVAPLRIADAANSGGPS
jgi:hypothetical protein